LPHGPLGDRADLGQDRDVLAQLQVGQVGQLAALGVAPGVVPEQLGDRGDLQLGGQRARRGLADQRLERTFQVVHSTPSASGRPAGPPRYTPTSTSGWARRRWLSSISPNPSGASSPSSTVTSSPPACSIRSTRSRAPSARSCSISATSPSIRPS